MSQHVGEKRGYDDAFPDTPCSSPEIPSKYPRTDSVADVAAPLLTAQTMDIDPPIQLAEKDLEVLSIPGLSASETSPEVSPVPTPPSSPAPFYQRIDSVQSVAGMSLTELTSPIGMLPIPKEVQVLPLIAKPMNPHSSMSHLTRRELGMSHQLQNPEYWFQKAREQYELNHNEEALKFCQRAIDCETKVRPLKAGYYLLKGEIEYELEKYSESAETWETLAKRSPLHEAEGYLKAALCSAKMRQWQPFKNYFKEFIEIWNYWFISEPSQCPLSSGQYVDHMGIFSNSIDDLLEFDQGEDLEAQFCTQLALFYLSDATGKDGRLHLERILGIDERRAFVFLVIYAIKRGSEEEKESCLTYIENQLMNEEIPMDIAERIASIHPVVIKIIFNQGLQNENIRLLQIASTYYELKTEMETEVELSLYYLNYLFFCALALQQIDKALEIARILEERTTGSGRVHLGLCDLAKGKPLTPNQVEDFNRSIQERQRSIADPHILRFISAQMLKGPGPGSILNVLSARFEKFARTFIHPWS